MRRPAPLFLCAALVFGPLAASVPAHAEDPMDCDAPGYYMPCGFEPPPPGDPIYQQALDDDTSGTPEQQTMAEQIANGINPDTGQPYGG